jgi:hypothetical protein
MIACTHLKSAMARPSTSIVVGAGIARDRLPAPRLLATWSLIVLAALCLPTRNALAGGKPLPWKSIEDALLRVDDAPPAKDWGIYQTEKKTDRLLIQIGNRFLLIEVHDRQIFEINPAKVQHKSAELLWDPTDRPTQPLATSDWSNDDAGAAFQLKAKLDSENLVLDLQLPHPPNVGDLPVRSTAPTRRRY